MDFNQRFMEVKFKMKEKERLQSLMSRAEEHRRELMEKKIKLQEILKKEQRDVEKLEGMSLSRFIHMIKRDMEDAIYKEQQEAISSKLKYDEVLSELEMVNNELKNTINQINSLGSIEEDYKNLLIEKEEYIKTNPSDLRDKLEEIINKQAELQREKKELKEALDAGQELILALERVSENLNSAENWGLYDILGGGIIATAAKHSRLDEASRDINEAQSLLKRFHRELSDLGEYMDISIDIGSFLGFADYFFDGFFADFAVQSKIKEAQDRVNEAYYKVNSLIEKIQSELNEADENFEGLDKERAEILERA